MSTTTNFSDTVIKQDGDVPAAPTLQYGILCTVLSITLFHCVNIFAERMATPQTISKRDQWKWRNVFVSWVHAPFSGVSAVAGWLMIPEMVKDIFHYSNYQLYTLAAFTLGYFLYDFIDILINRKVRACWEVTFHHIVTLPVMLYIVLMQSFVPHFSFMMQVEVNSFFLHTRKLMQMMCVSYDTWYYRLIVVLNLVTFAVFRGHAFYGFTALIIGEYDIVPMTFFIFCISAAFVLNIMNLILFWRLLKRDIFGKTRIKNGDHSNNNNNTDQKKKL